MGERFVTEQYVTGKDGVVFVKIPGMKIDMRLIPEFAESLAEQLLTGAVAARGGVRWTDCSACGWEVELCPDGSILRTNKLQPDEDPAVCTQSRNGKHQAGRLE